MFWRFVKKGSEECPIIFCRFIEHGCGDLFSKVLYIYNVLKSKVLKIYPVRFCRASAASASELLQAQLQPRHTPVALPFTWQWVLQVDSEAHRRNSDGDRYSSEQWHPYWSQTPDFLPTAWQVPLHTLSPRLHLLGRRALRSLSCIDLSEQWQFQSSSHIPEVCPRRTQPAEHAQSPNVHLNPAFEDWITATNRRVIPHKTLIFYPILGDLL